MLFFRPQCSTQRRKWLTGLLTLFFAVVLIGTAMAAAETLYLRIRSSPVRSEPSMEKGDQEGFVFLNQSFEVLERSEDKDWIKVRFLSKKGEKAEKREGWIHATTLAKEPAQTERGEGGTWLSDGGSALPEAGAVSTERAKQRQADLKEILTAEKLCVSADDLDRFLKDGRLGVYRTDWPSLEGGVTE